MRHSFLQTATGFLAAASLLSGSAFAFAPEFDEDLPTVIVTDRGYLTSAFDPAPYTFRYSAAFELLDYIDLKGNAPGDLKFLFTEFDFADPIPPVPNATGVLTINGATARTTIPTAAADFASAPAVVVGGTSALTFRNRDFSGADPNVNTGWDPVGDLTGYNIDLSGPQKRIVTLYVKGEPSTDFSFQTFGVITARQDGEYRWDELTASVFSDPFDAVSSWTTNFGGWGALNVLQLGFINTAGENRVTSLTTPPLNTNGITFQGGMTLGGATAPANTSSIGVSVPAARNNGLVVLASPNTPADRITFQADRLYRLRTKWSSPNAASTEAVRIRLGGQEVGSLEFIYDDSSLMSPVGSPLIPRIPATPTDDYVYFIPKGTSATASPSVFYDVLTLGISGQDLVIDEVEVSVTDRSKLTGAAIVFNRGGAVPTLAAGEIVPAPASPTGFNTAATPVFGQTIESVLSNAAAQPMTVTRSTASVVASFGAQTQGDADGIAPFVNVGNSGFAPPSFMRIWFSPEGQTNVNAAGAFNATADKLYIIDYYISSSTPNTVVAGGSPVQLRLFGRAAASKVYNNIFNMVDGSGTDALAAPRAFSAVVSDSTGPVNVGLDILSFAQRYVASSATPPQTFTIHRIVVTSFDNPSQ